MIRSPLPCGGSKQMLRLSSSNRLKSKRGSARRKHWVYRKAAAGICVNANGTKSWNGRVPASVKKRSIEKDCPRLRQLSDETVEIDTARIQRERRGPTPEDEPRTGTGEDQIRLSEEAQRRLAQETPAPPPPGEAIVPEPDDPLTVDTPRERQEADLSDQIDRGRNETQAGRQIGQVWIILLVVPIPGLRLTSPGISYRNHHQYPQAGGDPGEAFVRQRLLETIDADSDQKNG